MLVVRHRSCHSGPALQSKESVLVLHVVAPATVGGLERVVQLLAGGHQRRGHDVGVAVVLHDHTDHPFLAALAGTAVAVYPLAVRARHYGGERAAVAGLCRWLRPDVLHTHGYRPDVVDAGAARRLGIPTVTTVHGFTSGGWRNRLYERLQRAAFRRFDAVVAVSRPLADFLVRDAVPPEHIHLIRNAWAETVPALDRVAARRVLGLPDDRWCVGWVGRLGREKGPDVMLAALAALSDVAPLVAMVGAGRERAVLERRAAALGVAVDVRWHGMVPEAGRLFRAFDVFVLSSRTEGTPLVLFEAMAAGVPIVATGVGGVPDVVSSAEAELVAPNDPVALAAAIRRVHGDAAAASARARAAADRLRREFAVDPWLDRYAAVYEQVQRLAPV